MPSIKTNLLPFNSQSTFGNVEKYNSDFIPFVNVKLSTTIELFDVGKSALYGAEQTALEATQSNLEGFYKKSTSAENVYHQNHPFRLLHYFQNTFVKL